MFRLQLLRLMSRRADLVVQDFDLVVDHLFLLLWRRRILIGGFRRKWQLRSLILRPFRNSRTLLHSWLARRMFQLLLLLLLLMGRLVCVIFTVRLSLRLWLLLRQGERG